MRTRLRTKNSPDTISQHDHTGSVMESEVELQNNLFGCNYLILLQFMVFYCFKIFITVHIIIPTYFINIFSNIRSSFLLLQNLDRTTKMTYRFIKYRLECNVLVSVVSFSVILELRKYIEVK